MVSPQWQSEFMTVLQGDFEEELRRMSLDRGFGPRKLRDSCVSCGAPDAARRSDSREFSASVFHR
jgi:hypothetical protein